jgi:hypothetical protein
MADFSDNIRAQPLILRPTFKLEFKDTGLPTFFTNQVLNWAAFFGNFAEDGKN